MTAGRIFLIRMPAPATQPKRPENQNLGPGPSWPRRALSRLRAVVMGLFFTAAALAALGALPSSASDSGSAPAVRGWAIVNILRFSYWPSAAYGGAAAPTVICARPERIVLPDLYAIEGSKIHDRPLRLREFQDLSDVTGCHVVFFSEADMPDFYLYHAGQVKHPVAFVGDTEGFAESGGSFELILHEHNAFFRFNRKMLLDCGIQLAQSLMRMGALTGHDQEGSR